MAITQDRSKLSLVPRSFSVEMQDRGRFSHQYSIVGRFPTPYRIRIGELVSWRVFSDVVDSEVTYYCSLWVLDSEGRTMSGGYAELVLWNILKSLGYAGFEGNVDVIRSLKDLALYHFPDVEEVYSLVVNG